MIEITKDEAMKVREHFPDACIAKTRNKRYIEETEKYLALIPENIEAAELLDVFARQRNRKAKYAKATNTEG